MPRTKGSKNKFTTVKQTPADKNAGNVETNVETPVPSTVSKPGDTIKVVDQSEAYNRTETVAGVHEGKKAKFSEKN